MSHSTNLKKKTSATRHLLDIHYDHYTILSTFNEKLSQLAKISGWVGQYLSVHMMLSEEKINM